MKKRQEMTKRSQSVWAATSVWPGQEIERTKPIGGRDQQTGATESSSAHSVALRREDRSGIGGSGGMRGSVVGQLIWKDWCCSGRKSSCTIVGGAIGLAEAIYATLGNGGMKSRAEGLSTAERLQPRCISV